MSEQPATVDEQYASWLVACDEALASGEQTTLLEGVGVPAELRRRLGGDLRCLRWLRRMFPPSPGRPPAAAPSPTLAEGEFGRFRIRRSLGAGAYGEVFLAYDRYLCREVALKVPRPEVLLTPGFRERFLREARAAAGLDHPNLVPVYEAGTVGAVCFIASAYCPGPTLAAWLRERDEPVPWRGAAGLVADLARAIEHAHRRGVLHRDLKPSNILLQRKSQGPKLQPPAAEPAAEAGLDIGDFEPKVADFGLAKVAEGAPGGVPGPEGLTGTGAILGTPGYMAPEQAAGRAREVGAAADVYALGVILYELLAGTPPFRGETVLDTLEQVRTREPVPPTRLRPRLPRDLETICLKCLQKEPARRYASAAALAEDLERFGAGEPIAARPVGAAERAWRWARRRPAAALVLVSGVALLALVGVATSLLYSGRLKGRWTRRSRPGAARSGPTTCTALRWRTWPGATGTSARSCSCSTPAPRSTAPGNGITSGGCASPSCDASPRTTSPSVVSRSARTGGYLPRPPTTIPSRCGTSPPAGGASC